MKKYYPVSVFIFMLSMVFVPIQAASEELSLNKVFETSKEKQLCGEYAADKGVFKKFIFTDGNNVTVVAGMEFPWTYYISDNVVYIKTDKAFLELVIESSGLLTGKDLHTKGNTYQKIASIEKTCLPPKKTEMAGLVCFANGILLQKEGKINEAAEKYLQCCQSGDARSCNHHGLLKSFSREKEAARISFQKACDMGFGEGCSNLAYYEEMKENLKEAKALYQQACDKGFKRGCIKAFELKPDSSEALFERGLAYFDKQKYERAVINFTKAIELDPNFADAYSYRGTIFEWQGKYNLAVSDFTQLLKFAPNNWKVYRIRGINYFYGGEFESAATDFRQAIGLHPDDEYGYLHLVNASNRKSKHRNPQDMATLRNFVNQTVSNEWVRTISKYYLGEYNIDEQDVLQAARNGETPEIVNGRRCEAYYYIAEERLRKRDREGAAEFFKQSIATGETNFNEYWLSKLILERIE